MSSLPKPFYTPEQYLEIERQAPFKSEYLAGEIFAMAGATEEHNLIVANIIGELRMRLKGRPCKTYPSDMKVETGPAGLYTYPDVTGVCRDATFHDARRDMLLNPTVIVEVLSLSTEGYDRGAKFAQYRRLQSLASYIMVASTERRVEHYERQSDGSWRLTEATDEGAFCLLPALNCNLPLSEIYDRVEFPHVPV